MKSTIKSLQGEKWDILPSGFLTQDSLHKLQEGKNALHEFAKLYFNQVNVRAELEEKFGQCQLDLNDIKMDKLK